MTNKHTHMGGTMYMYEHTRRTLDQLAAQTERFDVAISNPPYQGDTAIQRREDGRTQTKPIFDEFQKNAGAIAEQTSMVYPASWQSSKTYGLGHWLHYNGVVDIENYSGEDIFDGGIEKGYPISITHTRNGYTGTYTLDGIEQDPDSEVWVDTPAKQIAVERTQHLPMLNGIAHLTSLKNIETSGITFYNTPDGLVSPVRFYIKQTASLIADGGWYYAEEDDLAPHYKDPQDINKYLVSIPYANFFRRAVALVMLRRHGTFRVIPHGARAGFGQSWVKLRGFDTAQEAQNFAKYFNSKLPTALASLVLTKTGFGSTVPDLGDYTNNNPVFTPDAALPDGHEYNGLTLDQRLYSYFCLSDAEVEVFEDPAYRV